MGEHELLETPELTAAEREAIVSEAAHTADFLICRNRIRLLANTPAPIGSFSIMYGRFRADGPCDGPADLLLYCRDAAGPDEHTVTFLAGPQAFRIRDPEVVGHMFSTIAYLVYLHIRTHYFVHAGCVARNGRGIIIAGNSGMGKTTMTSFLVSRGMGYLSDELAPICRADGTVDPFPLRLGIRPGPAGELTKDLPAEIYDFTDDHKRLVDVKDLCGGAVTGPVPLHAAVFLSQRPSAGVATSSRFDGPVMASFLDSTPAFRDALLAETGARILREEHLHPRIASWLLRVDRSEGFLQKLYAVARRHDVPVAGIEYEDLEEKDFSGTPRLLPLPKAAGVIELIKKMPPSLTKQAIDREFGGKTTAFVSEVTKRLEPVAFYKLSPGRLDEMVSAVENLP